MSFAIVLLHPATEVIVYPTVCSHGDEQRSRLCPVAGWDIFQPGFKQISLNR